MQIDYRQYPLQFSGKLYHGTTPERLESILRDGLMYKAHFATSVAFARDWGPVVLEIDGADERLERWGTASAEGIAECATFRLKPNMIIMPNELRLSNSGETSLPSDLSYRATEIFDMDNVDLPDPPK